MTRDSRDGLAYLAMPLWLLDAVSKYPDGTKFVLDCDACPESIAVCDSDVKSSAPISKLLDEVASTDWQVMRSDKPGVTTKFVCPRCQAARRDSELAPLPAVTPERPSPFERIKAAGELLKIGDVKRWKGVNESGRADDLTPMLPPCIFCDNESGSEEHLWAAWMHRHMAERGINLGPLRVQEGSGPEVIEDSLEKTINTVCHTCNNIWMSLLEGKNKPALETMLDGLPTKIDPGRLRLLTEWAVKTAMVSDSIKPRNDNENFYTRDERTAMREKRTIPDRTRIWLGALTEPHFGCHGTDFTIMTNQGKTRIGTGTVNTIAAGQFVVQVVTEHVYPEYAHLPSPLIQPAPGISDSRLIQIYPNKPKSVDWPPEPFTNGGPNGYGYLLHRWRIGEKTDKINNSRPHA